MSYQIITYAPDTSTDEHGNYKTQREARQDLKLYRHEAGAIIYDLDRYDQVIVATDAQNINEEGKRSLTGALRACGNTHITFVEWRDQP